ncbi:uncharacterized protein [Branchiostoma lanceolatum]|uniref:uncharacterized protein isoform X3 n=1 Tax=Branchiostoma lanceolatum TaxID=7740 RepID=UPI0034561AEF
MASKDTGIKKTVAEKTAAQGQKTSGDKTKDAGRRNVSSSKVQSLHNLRNQTERTFRRKNLTNSGGKSVEEEEDRIGKLLGRLDRTLDGLKATDIVSAGAGDNKGVKAGTLGTSQKHAEQTSSAAANAGKGGLEGALAGMLHGPTIKDKTSKENAPIVGPDGIPTEKDRWGSEYVTLKQGAATMQSAAPTQAAATIKSADTTQSAASHGPGLSAALEGMLHGPTIKDKTSKEKAPIVGPDGIPTEKDRWGSEYVTLKQGAATMQSAAPTQAAATIKSADTTQSAASPGPGLSAALEGMLHGPTIKDKTSKEKAPIVGPGGIPKEDVRWPEYGTEKQGAVKMQSAAPTQAAATIKSADTTQSAAPPGPGLSAALEGMLHGPTIKDKTSKEKAPIVGPGGVPKEDVRWPEYGTDKQGAAKMQSATPTQAAATIKSADTTQSAAPPGPGLSAALAGMLHGPTIKDKTSKEKAPIVGPGGVPKEDVRWPEYGSDKQGAVKMQSAAPTQAAATIKSADTTQSAAPPGTGLSAALDGMLHGPTIKDKTSKEKAPIVGPGGVPKEDVRWPEYGSDKQGAVKMQSAAPTQAAATIKSADTTQSAAPPGPGLSAALEGMLHGPTIKDKTSKEKAPIVGPGGVPKEDVRWPEYGTEKQGAVKMQSAAPTQAAATIKSADTTQSAAPPGPGLSAALEGMLHGPTIKDKTSKEKAPIVGPGGVPKEDVRWPEYGTEKQGAAKMQSAAPMQAAATIKSADTTQSAAPPGPGLSAALEGMLHGPTIKDKNQKKKNAPVVGPDSIPTEEVRWGEQHSGKQGAAKMQSAAPTQAAATIKSADTTHSAAPPGPGLSAALEGMLHGPTIKDKNQKKKNAPVVGPDSIPTEEVRWGEQHSGKQGAVKMQSAAPMQAAATIKSADTTQSTAPPGAGLSAALEGMLHGPTIKDKTSKEKAPIVGPGGVPKEDVRWPEYDTGKQGAAKMQSAAPMQAAATIKSADTTQSAAPPGPGLSAALDGMLHGPTIKDKNQKKKNAPVVGPDSIPTEEVRWGEQHSGKQGAAKMQSAAPMQAAATIKSADTTQSAAPPGPGLSAALEGMLHGPTIKDRNQKKKNAPVVGPDSIPTEEVRWGEQHSGKQGAAKMQSAAPTQAAATIKSADTTQSAAPPGPGLSAALEGMLHGPTIKDKNQKKKNAPVVGPDSIPTEEVRWGEQHSGKGAKGSGQSNNKSGGRKGSGKKKGKK